MTDDKYVRVSNTLYEEHSPTGGRPLKWPKALESLYLELFDARAVEGSSFAGMPPLDSGECNARAWRRRVNAHADRAT